MFNNIVLDLRPCRPRGVASLRAGLFDDIGKMASQLGAGAGAPIGRPLFGDFPDPSWPTLRSEAIATTTGESMEENKRYAIRLLIVQF